MNAAMSMQWMVVLIAVLGSIAYLVCLQWPVPVGRARRTLVIWMLRPQRVMPLRWLGRVLTPLPSVRLSMSACGACGQGKPCAPGSSGSGNALHDPLSRQVTAPP